MNILLSNDDGYRAEGLNVLERVLAERGHDIYVSAPDTQQSGKSHSMTIHGRVTVTEYAPHHFHVSGTPADCIIYSHRCSLFPVEFDAVVSGINHGYNLSADVIYSGTCAAARQAALYRIPAIALSASTEGGSGIFRKAAEYAAANLERLASAIAPDTFMNINFPPSFSGCAEPAGIGYTAYYDDVEVVEDQGGLKHLAITGYHMERRPCGRELPADFEVCARGNASISIIECFPSLSAEAMARL